MVKRKHLVEEHQRGIGHAELVLRDRGQRFDLADHVVGEESDGARGKRRQALDARRGMAAQRLLERLEDVALDRRLRSLAAIAPGLGDLERAAPGDDGAIGPNADEGVAPDLLAALNRLEQKALRLVGGQAQEGGHRGFKVGRQGEVERYQGVVLRQPQELRAAGQGLLGSVG